MLPKLDTNRQSEYKGVKLKDDHEEWSELIKQFDKKIPKYTHIRCQICQKDTILAFNKYSVLSYMMYIYMVP